MFIFFQKNFKILNKYLTIYTQVIQFWNTIKIWWERRFEFHKFVQTLFFKKKKVYYKLLDYHLTYIINLIYKKIKKIMLYLLVFLRAIIVEVGVPLNLYPSNGVHPHLLSIFSFLISIVLFISTIVKSASYTFFNKTFILNSKNLNWVFAH